jgi:hypothetical protein
VGRLSFGAIASSFTAGHSSPFASPTPFTITSTITTTLVVRARRGP